MSNHYNQKQIQKLTAKLHGNWSFSFKQPKQHTKRLIQTSYFYLSNNQPITPANIKTVDQLTTLLYQNWQLGSNTFNQSDLINHILVPQLLKKYIPHLAPN